MESEEGERRIYLYIEIRSGLSMNHVLINRIIKKI